MIWARQHLHRHGKAATVMHCIALLALTTLCCLNACSTCSRELQGAERLGRWNSSQPASQSVSLLKSVSQSITVFVARQQINTLFKITTREAVPKPLEGSINRCNLKQLCCLKIAAAIRAKLLAGQFSSAQTKQYRVSVAFHRGPPASCCSRSYRRPAGKCDLAA
jgi:hypothetical protein